MSIKIATGFMNHISCIEWRRDIDAWSSIARQLNLKRRKRLSLPDFWQRIRPPGEYIYAYQFQDLSVDVYFSNGKLDKIVSLLETFIGEGSDDKEAEFDRVDEVLEVFDTLVGEALGFLGNPIYLGEWENEGYIEKVGGRWQACWRVMNAILAVTINRDYDSDYYEVMEDQCILAIEVLPE